MSSDSSKPLSFSFAAFAEHFDDHIRLSIRGYDDLISDCLSLSVYFIEDETVALDIGCSAGSFLRRLQKHNIDRAPHVKYVGIDVEEQFTTFWEPTPNIEFALSDIRKFEIPAGCSFITGLFSLQFIAERERQEVLKSVFDRLITGGALVLAEKTLSPSAKLQDMLTFIHYDFKRRNFSETEILEKERSLRSLMKSWTEKQIVKALIEAGFASSSIQCFWRNHNFAGFLALKA